MRGFYYSPSLESKGLEVLSGQSVMYAQDHGNKNRTYKAATWVPGASRAR